MAHLFSGRDGYDDCRRYNPHQTYDPNNFVMTLFQYRKKNDEKNEMIGKVIGNDKRQNPVEQKKICQMCRISIEGIWVKCSSCTEYQLCEECVVVNDSEGLSQVDNINT